MTAIETGCNNINEIIFISYHTLFSYTDNLYNINTIPSSVSLLKQCFNAKNLFHK